MYKNKCEIKKRKRKVSRLLFYINQNIVQQKQQSSYFRNLQ